MEIVGNERLSHMLSLFRPGEELVQSPMIHPCSTYSKNCEEAVDAARGKRRAGK